MAGSSMVIDMNDVAKRKLQRASDQAVFDINTALDESMLEANDPNAKRYSHAEMVERMNKRHEARLRV